MNFQLCEVVEWLNRATDDMIKLHQSMAHTNAEAHSALSKAVQQAHEDLTRQSEFTAAVESFQQRLQRDLESSSAEYRSTFAKAVKGMESFTQSTLNRLKNVVKSVERDFANLDEVRPTLNNLPTRRHC